LTRGTTFFDAATLGSTWADCRSRGRNLGRRGSLRLHSFHRGSASRETEPADCDYLDVDRRKDDERYDWLVGVNFFARTQRDVERDKRIRRWLPGE
jgi:hypothetical protein